MWGCYIMIKNTRSYLGSLQGLQDVQQDANTKRSASDAFEGESEADISKKRFRSDGGGRKQQALEVREAAFQWFVDVRGSLKARLPLKMFKAKCQELYDTWLTTLQ